MIETAAYSDSCTAESIERFLRQHSNLTERDITLSNFRFEGKYTLKFEKKTRRTFRTFTSY